MLLLTVTLHHIVPLTSDSSVPDDFLNLYPEDVPDNLGDLAGTGFAPTPLLIGAVLLIVIGLVTMSSRRKRRLSRRV